MKQFYNVKCRRCGKSIRWDRLNPQACKCGSRAAIYRRRIVCIDDTRVALGKADKEKAAAAIALDTQTRIVELEHERDAATARAERAEQALNKIVAFFKCWYAGRDSEPDFDGDNDTQRLSQVYHIARAALAAAPAGKDGEK